MSAVISGEFHGFFDKLAETSPVAITVVDEKGRIIYANNKAEDVLGLEKSEITDRTYDDPNWKITDFEGNDFPSEKLPFQIVKRTKEPVYDVRHAIEWPDGKRKLLSVNASPLFDDDGDFESMVATIDDITEQVKIRKELQENKKRYGELIEKMSSGVAVYEPVEGGNDFVFKEFNKAAEKIDDISRDEVIGRKLTEVFPYVEEFGLLEVFKRVNETGEPESHPVSIYEDERIKGWRTNYVYKLPSGEVVAVYEDVTEKKHLEEKRKQSLQDLGERYKELNLLYGIAELSVNRDNTISEILQQSVDLIPPSWQYPDITCARITYEEDEYKTDNFRQTKWGQTEDLFVDGQKVGIIEVYYLKERKELDEGPFLEEERDLLNSLSRILGQIISKRETERRKDQLNSLLRSIRDINQLIVKEEDRDRLLKGACEILQKTRGYDYTWIALLGDSSGVESLAQSGLGEERERLKKILNKDQLPNHLQEVLDEPDVKVTPDTEYCFTEKRLEPTKDRSLMTCSLEAGGEVYGLLSVSASNKGFYPQEERDLLAEVAGDIAFALRSIEIDKERERVTRELARQKRLLSQTQSLAKVGGWEYDVEEDCITWTEETYQIYGVDKEEYDPNNVQEDIKFYSPEDKEIVQEAFNKAVTEGEPYDLEVQFNSADGEKLWVRTVGQPIEDNGQVTKVIGHIMDITEQKEREIQLDRSEKRYRTVFENTGTAMIIIEKDTTISLANEQAERLSGYSKEEIEGKMSWTKWVANDEDLERMKGYHRTRREDPTAAPNQYEFKLVDREGVEKDVLITIDVIPGTKKSVASLNDITDQKNAQAKLRQSFVELAETTSRVLGVRDPYTQHHEQRVAELAREVGKRMDLDEEKLLGLYIGGVLHDIGKIVVPETILTKPGKLKDVEWEMIRSHPKVGYNQILKDTDFPWPVAEMTLHHHERLDGSGYPDGLEGDELTTEVRILGAVDVVEAMSTRRPYRAARSKERTLSVIKEGRGNKFDPEIVDILVDMIEEGEIEFGEK